MNETAISHRCAFSDCYCISKDELRINLRTGKDITRVELIYEDPFHDGISDKSKWQGKPLSMIKTYELKNQIIWSCKLNPAYKRVQYYFEINCNDEQLFLLEDGLCTAKELNTPGKIIQYFIMPWMNPADIITVPEWAKDTIWYQIFPDRFCRGDFNRKRKFTKPWNSDNHMTYFDYFGGDLKGIRNRLDYLEQLGITGIYLNPIFTAESNHKFNTTDYKTIDPDFGTEDDLKQLIKDAHERNIKIMLDAVFNHSGEDFAPWQDVLKHGIQSKYYNWFYVNHFPINTKDPKSKDGRFFTFAFESNMPKLNTCNPEVINYFCDLCKYWVQTWDIDGIRFDVGNEISHQFIKILHNTLKKIKPDLYLLGEIWHDSVQWLQGDEYDSVMNYPFVESINDFWNDKTKSSNDLKYAVNRCYSMYSEQTNTILFNLLDSHDMDRLYSRCKENMDAFFQQLTILFTLQGSICIYYGTEIAMSGSHDPQNRKCMPWNAIDHGTYDAIWQQVHQLIELRKEYDACKTASIYWHNTDQYPRLIHYEKHGTNRTDQLEVYLNAGKKSVPINTLFSTTGRYKILFSRNYADGRLMSGGTIILKNED